MIDLTTSVPQVTLHQWESTWNNELDLRFHIVVHRTKRTPLPPPTLLPSPAGLPGPTWMTTDENFILLWTNTKDRQSRGDTTGTSTLDCRVPWQPRRTDWLRERGPPPSSFAEKSYKDTMSPNQHAARNWTRRAKSMNAGPNCCTRRRLPGISNLGGKGWGVGEV